MTRPVKDVRRTVEAEACRWPGLRIAWDVHTKHPRVILRWRRRERFMVVAATPSDRRAALNMVCQVRRMVRNLGVKERT